MNIRSHLRFQALFCATILIFTGFMSMQKTWAQSGMSAPDATGTAKNARGLTPDTLLVKLQVDPNQPPIELTLKQFMQKYNIPGLSVAHGDTEKTKSLPLINADRRGSGRIGTSGNLDIARHPTPESQKAGFPGPRASAEADNQNLTTEARRHGENQKLTAD